MNHILIYAAVSPDLGVTDVPVEPHLTEIFVPGAAVRVVVGAAVIDSLPTSMKRLLKSSYSL